MTYNDKWQEHELRLTGAHAYSPITTIEDSFSLSGYYVKAMDLPDFSDMQTINAIISKKYI